MNIKTKLQIAEKWFNEIGRDKTYELKKKYFPNAYGLHPEDILTIYTFEHPELPTTTPKETAPTEAIKEDDELRMAYQSADMADYENKTGQYADQTTLISNSGEDEMSIAIRNACLIALEFGYKQCENGENLQAAFMNYDKFENKAKAAIEANQIK